MLKQSLILVVIFLAGSKAQDLVTCFNGTIGYTDQGVPIFNESLNFIRCREGEMCGQFTWRPVGTNLTFQAGFCTPEPLSSCDALNPFVPVSNRSSCEYLTCNSSMCNSFRGPVCSSGSQLYNRDRTAIIQSYNVSYQPGFMGDQCYIYTYTSPDNTYVLEFGLFETGVRYYTNESVTDCAAVLNSLPGVSNITTCSYTAQSSFSLFTIPLPTSTAYRCNQGVMVYSVDRDIIYSAENITNDPCRMGDVCGMFRFVNTNENNQTAYIESGFCIAPLDAANLTCNMLNGYPGVGTVSDCTFSACSGDYCEEFNATAVLPGCPARPTEEEIQILPGCSARQVLTGAATCISDFVTDFSLQSETEQCRGNIDNAITCMSNLVQTCVRFSDQGELCNSVITRIPQLSRQNLTSIFQMVRYFASNVTSMESLQQLVGVLLTDSGVDPSMFMVDVCSFGSLTDILLQAINNIRDTNFNVSLPICQDNEVGDDLIRLGLDYAREIIASNDQQGVCAAFDTLKERLQDVIINRCGLLETIRPFLSNMMGPDFAMLSQGGFDSLLEMFNNLQFPGCGDTEDNANVELPDCSRFYEAQGTCAITQAWLCDYVTWKVEFVTVWLRRFTQYARENMINIPAQLPGCMELSRNDLCVNNGQLRCYNTMDGCELCYCRDLNFRDLSNVREIYRRDWNNWRRVFQLYRNFAPSDTCSVN